LNCATHVSWQWISVSEIYFEQLIAFLGRFSHFLKNLRYVRNVRPIRRRGHYPPVHGIQFGRMTVQSLNGFSHEICIAHYLLLSQTEPERVEIGDVLIVGDSWRDHNRKMRSAFIIWSRDAISITASLLAWFIPTNRSRARGPRLGKRGSTAFRYRTIVAHLEVKSLKQCVIFHTVFAIHHPKHEPLQARKFGTPSTAGARVKQPLAVIPAADVEGYRRLSGNNEEGAVAWFYSAPRDSSRLASVATLFTPKA
jgi:hypothetical protein